MIMKLLEVRTFLMKIYQKGRFIINPVVKFFLSMWVFNWINSQIGFDARFTSKTVVLLMSLICSVTPGGVAVFFAMVLSLVHVFSASIFIAALLLLMYMVLYGLLMRFDPEHAIAVVAIPVLAKYNLHYCVPMVLGCTATPVSALPCACGAIIYYMMGIVKAASGREVSLKDLDAVLELYTEVVQAYLANKQMIITIGVFALVITTIYIIRKFSFDYALLVSVGAGILVNILGFLVADLHFDVPVKAGTLIFMSLVAGAVALISEYFKRVLDYTAIERVQFEDDDYYYYVKAVPKVNISAPHFKVKHMSDYNEDDGADDDFDDYGPDDDGPDFKGAYRPDEEEDDDIKVAPVRGGKTAKSRFAFDRNDYIRGVAAEPENEITYEDFGDLDFEDPVVNIDDDEDLSSYGLKNIKPEETDDEGYEVEMTLDDENR